MFKRIGRGFKKARDWAFQKALGRIDERARRFRDAIEPVDAHLNNLLTNFKNWHGIHASFTEKGRFLGWRFEKEKGMPSEETLAQLRSGLLKVQKEVEGIREEYKDMQRLFKDFQEFPHAPFGVTDISEKRLEEFRQRINAMPNINAMIKSLEPKKP